MIDTVQYSKTNIIFTNEILDKNGNIDVIYMDFMKAFDKVPHRRLIQKIKSYGISEQVASWIQAFLSDRKQRVSIKSSTSTWANVVS